MPKSSHRIRNPVGWWVGLLAFSAATMGFYSDLVGKVTIVNLPSPNIISNIAIVVVAMCLLGLDPHCVSRLRISAAPFTTQFSIRNRQFRSEPVDPSELPEMYLVYKAVLGSDLLPESQTLTWLERCPTACWKVVETFGGEKEESVVGFFDIVPLSTNGVSRIGSGDRKVRPWQVDDIASTHKGCRHFYVASAGATSKDQKVRAAVITGLKSILRKHSKAKEITVYARPASPDGLRLLTSSGFQKINERLVDSETYWMRTFDSKSLNGS